MMAIYVALFLMFVGSVNGNYMVLFNSACNKMMITAGQWDGNIKYLAPRRNCRCLTSEIEKNAIDFHLRILATSFKLTRNRQCVRVRVSSAINA